MKADGKTIRCVCLRKGWSHNEVTEGARGGRLAPNSRKEPPSVFTFSFSPLDNTLSHQRVRAVTAM
jgi:hypothetical protein